MLAASITKTIIRRFSTENTHKVVLPELKLEDNILQLIHFSLNKLSDSLDLIKILLINSQKEQFQFKDQDGDG